MRVEVCRQLLASALLVFGAVAATHAEPIRLSADAFGTVAEIEVRDLPREQAKEAARAALHEIFEISQLLDPAGQRPGGLGMLNVAAGSKDLQSVEARVGELLRRGLQFCLWTNGAHGPLGGELYRIWGSTENGKMPDPIDLRDAVIGSDCSQMSLDLSTPEARVAIGVSSQLEAVGLGRGFAIDRAAEILLKAGVTNAWLEIGAVWRAIGPGADGDGWRVDLPPIPGTDSDDPMDRIWLRDQSLAMASVAEVEGKEKRVLIDQRTGVPARGVVAVVTVTELAVDADALATILFITGLREGQMRLGSLQPRPSVLWQLGQGKGTPLESTYRWSEIKRVRRRY